MKQILISMFILILISSCSSVAPAPTATVLPSSTNVPTATVTSSPPTATEAPTATAELGAAAKLAESQYRASLTPEQQALFDQSADRTAEGLSRSFLTGDLSSYLVYQDTNDNNEVTSVWNPETNKANPALFVDGNLFINAAGTGSEIIYNPEMDRTQAKNNLSNYMRYVRAQVCAKGSGVMLPKTLDTALADPKAQKFLADSCNITLHRSAGANNKHPYKVPEQQMSISGKTGIVFKIVDKPQNNMIITENAYDSNIFNGWGFEQDNDGPLIVSFFNQGAEDLNQYQEYQDYILARRLANAMESLFTRAEKNSNGVGEMDSVTARTIFNVLSYSDLPKTPIIFSKTR